MHFLPYLLRPLAHGSYGNWDEILFLGLAFVVLVGIFASGWFGRTTPDEISSSHIEEVIPD